ncbi:serine/threonine-protein kinase M1 [Elasticomyces elasticus]|nr:serine/threonine-protein kinase M1 [Elasticomyces elasticus]
MARRISEINGDAPPPSTLAAQFVQKQTGPAPQQNGPDVQLKDLLHEILHNPKAVQETSLGVNVKLIHVVAEAGLAPLVQNDTFGLSDALLALARDSIAVIEKIIKRQPELLLTPTSESGPPLALLLFTRLATVCGRRSCHNLRIAQLLDTLVRALEASIDFWRDAEIVKRLIRDIVNGSITLIDLPECLRALGDLTISNGRFQCKLPSPRMLAELWRESANEIALPYGCQTTVEDRAHAFMLALYLSELSSVGVVWQADVQARLQRSLSILRPALEKAKQWQDALYPLLAMSNNAHFLQALAGGIDEWKVPAEVQQQLAARLLDVLRSGECCATGMLLPQLQALAAGASFEELHEDLKIAVATWLVRMVPEQQLPDQILQLRNALHEDIAMIDSDLHETLKKLSVGQQGTLHGPRRRKRRRLSAQNEPVEPATISSELIKLLSNDETGGCELASLPDVAASAYVALNAADRSRAWALLAEQAKTEYEVVASIVTKLLPLPSVIDNKLSRLGAMLAVRVAVPRIDNKDFLDLHKSRIGQFCVTSLGSSNRELRIAAGQCLPHFLRHGLPGNLTTTNRHCAMNYLRTLSERDVPSMHETLISAWAQLALACDETELNLVLLRLTDYLGHPNALICAAAYVEIEKLAAARQQNVDDLFEPYWSTISVAIVQDLLTRPQKAQQICDLLGTDINNFLLTTQRFTVPNLVLTKRRDVLQRIAAARGTANVSDLIVQPKINLAATMSLLLTQATNDPEEATLECLDSVGSIFRGQDLKNFIKIDAPMVAFEMLKRTADVAPGLKPRYYKAIQVFANIAERRPGQSKAHGRANKALLEFFNSHILGVMAHFSGTLENAAPLLEKIRCLKAVQDMIHLIKNRVGTALPQLRACLQSAMSRPELCEHAFSVWLDLLTALDAEDMARMLGQSFALVIHHWPDLSPEMHQATHAKIGELIKVHQKTVQENVMYLPSLAHIELLSKFAAEIEHLQSHESTESRCTAFETRLRDESLSVVRQALRELVPFLVKQQEFIHSSAVSEQPVLVLSLLLRALLDVATRFSAEDTETAALCGKALGIIGCLDPNRVEATRARRKLLVLSNFDRATEAIDWAAVMLEDVLVKAFKSTTDPRSQGFMAYVMQELLRFCGFNSVVLARTRGSSQASAVQDRWMAMPENIRTTLTPFLSSSYHISNAQSYPEQRAYPGFSMDSEHSTWLRSLVYDLMWRGKGDNASMIFPLVARLVRTNDIAIAKFLLPFAVLNVVLGGTVHEVQCVGQELLAVLQCQPSTGPQMDIAKQCGETVFCVLDYISSWLQQKKKFVSQTRADAFRTGCTPSDFNEASDMAQTEEVERFLAAIPAEASAARALQCGSYARALFNWEQHIRQQRGGSVIPAARLSANDEALYQRLHGIYASIDEPDGLEGLGGQLSFLTEEQQTMQHTKAGRWTAASAWYEKRLASEPTDGVSQMQLLDCLRQTGQYAPLLRYADAFLRRDDSGTAAQILPLAAEAQWMTGDLTPLNGLNDHPALAQDVDVAIGQLLSAIRDHQDEALLTRLSSLRTTVVQSMSETGTSSLQACHDNLKKLHALYELEAMSQVDEGADTRFLECSSGRLATLGSYNADKQYVLGIRRAVMRIRQDVYSDSEAGALWLTTARLARKAGNTHSAYNAVLQASACGDHAAKLEEARLLWHDGHQRQAIQALQSAIDSGIFDDSPDEAMENSESSIRGDKQNLLAAKAHLVLAKWLDASGQSQAKDMTTKYQFAAKNFQRWEKGHYYLGKHYNKLLEAERALPRSKQSAAFLSGETTKAVIENLMRSIPFGNKYWHETIPKVLTLWLDLGLETQSRGQKEDQTIYDKRCKALQAVNKQFQKYYERIPAYVFYTALPQMLSRISHPHKDVWRQLSNCLTRIITSHPSQAMWYILPVLKATDRTRVERGTEILKRLRDPKQDQKVDATELRTLIVQSQKLSDALLQASERPVEARKSHISLTKDLDFNVKLAPIALVVPVEATLTANLPTDANTDRIRKHKAFAQDKITIQSFKDEVLVLSSLQRPRKINVRGSDGKLYGLLCKPKDDLRKDQRLMDFNGIINRALKRDAESSKRQLYIKTYAVTPLSEESGTLEWVEGIKPMRDILIGAYQRKGTRIDYNRIKDMLESAKAPAEYSQVFTDEVLPSFPAILHEWFTETYSDPEIWFAARLRYARSAAVMSMVGHILGLGDRHGENILLQEGTGGVFHVDFNCLFDKGRTFDRPELVPFRLTHNMVDAMGAYGYEGPFRKSSELTLGQLRQNRDTLMTVLETFLYDPTTDFIGKKKRNTAGVPETPQEILDSVGGRLKGLLRGENVPLGVEGYVDALIQEATSHENLAQMYIGWCAFL